MQKVTCLGCAPFQRGFISHFRVLRKQCLCKGWLRQRLSGIQVPSMLLQWPCPCQRQGTTVKGNEHCRQQ